jgi:hypothetical protein
MIALVVIAWEMLTWGLYYVTYGSGGDTGMGLLFGTAAIAGPLVIIPAMSKVGPKSRSETFGERLYRQNEGERRRIANQERVAEAARRRAEKLQQRGSQ